MKYTLVVQKRRLPDGKLSKVVYNLDKSVGVSDDEEFLLLLELEKCANQSGTIRVHILGKEDDE